MTKYKHYEFGNLTFKPYFKKVGHGWEVGVQCKGKTVFVGNFVHDHEARTWWTLTHKHMQAFFRHHEYVPTASTVWYCKYFGNYMYKHYYAWLDKTFAKYTKTYTRQNVVNFRQYKRFEKTYNYRAA